MPSTEPIYKDVVVLGCGNILFGDDGFGTQVAEHLEREDLIPSHVSVINAGTGVREILFDLVISNRRPKKVIIIDAVDSNLVTTINTADYRYQEIPDAWFQRDFLPRLKVE